jgi:hypothetical protein
MYIRAYMHASIHTNVVHTYIHVLIYHYRERETSKKMNTVSDWLMNGTVNLTGKSPWDHNKKTTGFGREVSHWK